MAFNGPASGNAARRTLKPPPTLERGGLPRTTTVSPELSASIKQRLVKARTQLVLDEPFFGVLVQQLPLLEDPSCKTMWTDGVNIGYNPNWVAGITDEELKGTLCHEVLHVANGHCWRRGDRDPGDWNKACDYVINPIVLDAKFLVPGNVLIDPQFKGKPAEEVYDTIHQPKPQSSGTQQGGKGAGKNPLKDASSPEGQQGLTEKGYAGGDDGAPDGSKGGGSNAGSDADGNSLDNSPGISRGEDRDHGDPVYAGEVRDAPKDKDRKQLAQQWKQAVEQAAKAASMRGTLPGNLKRVVQEALKPDVNWQDVMRQFVHQSWTAADYSWRMPSPRYLAQGLYLPRLASETLPCLIFAWDTSGSIWRRLLAAFQGTCKDIVDEMRPEETILLYCDAAIQRVDRFLAGDTVEFVPLGGGGTDFRPVFNWVEKEGIAPTCLVYLTDLQGAFPESSPEYPVLWVTPPTRQRPPWGDHIEMRI